MPTICTSYDFSLSAFARRKTEIAKERKSGLALEALHMNYTYLLTHLIYTNYDYTWTWIALNLQQVPFE